MLDAALLLLEMQVPRLLTEYAAGRHTSHSLRPEAWARLMGRAPEQEKREAVSPAEHRVEPDGSNTERQQSGREERDNGEIEEDAEPEWLPSLRRTLVSEGSRGDKGKALGRIVAFLKEPALELEAGMFAGFAEELLRQHASSRTSNTLKTLQARVVAVANFNEQDPAELLVRPWEQRRLKTPNATRKLPLHALLRTNDLRELEEWKCRRQKENEKVSSPSPFFFSIPGMNYLFVPEGAVFPIIHDALRSATGGRTLHFHHLRHSFASWLSFR